MANRTWISADLRWIGLGQPATARRAGPGAAMNPPRGPYGRARAPPTELPPRGRRSVD